MWRPCYTMNSSSNEVFLPGYMKTLTDALSKKRLIWAIEIHMKFRKSAIGRMTSSCGWIILTSMIECIPSAYTGANCKSSAWHLTPVRYTSFCIKWRKISVKKELEENSLAVTSDGTTRLGEVIAFVVHFTSKWKIQQHLARKIPDEIYEWRRGSKINQHIFYQPWYSIPPCKSCNEGESQC